MITLFWSEKRFIAIKLTSFNNIFKTILKVVEIVNIKESGYRILTNCGENGHQEVQHLHFHILGGQPLGSFIKKLDII